MIRKERASNRCSEPARTWRDERKLLGMVAADDGGASAQCWAVASTLRKMGRLSVWAGVPLYVPPCVRRCVAVCTFPCVPVCAGVYLALCASVSVRAFPSRYAALGRTRGPGTRTSASPWSTLALLLYHEEPEDKDQKITPEILAHS